jgi:hypothetical protein
MTSVVTTLYDDLKNTSRGSDVGIGEEKPREVVAGGEIRDFMT